MHTTTFALLAISALASSVSAQVYLPFNATSVPQGTRDAWCVQQQASCGLLCLDQSAGTPEQNDCDPSSLAYHCICADGAVPNATEYSQTIPFYQCQTIVQACADACNQVSSCVAACQDNKPCGATDPTRVNTTSTASTPSSTSATADSTQVYTGLGGAASTTGSGGSGSTSTASAGGGVNLGGKSAAVLAFGEVYGASVMIISMAVSIFVFLQ